ncbi:MAG TPA: tetratricopeptide repeat protein [Candidatus Eisenbacteria bacterium]|nr:tetratricopeptide repeat protein [Candidatus Eisenbacteria bacterium]
MSDPFHDRAAAEFLRAAALAGADRRAYLEALSASDPALGREVESLLEHDGTAEPILRTGEPVRVMAGALPPPERIGPYVVLEEIGRGGMGVVYRAERREPVRITIALKLIRPGFETDRVLARFESERRILALMDHPGIARVFDAGVSHSRPYVAMEYVRGAPITRFCDERRLTLAGRLHIYLGVCEAIHHAHQNAIIHRDLKPSNVLVTLHDERPVAKVIDFGIAKAFAADAPAGSTLTVAGEFVGTPAYMSPEQALARPRIDLRADVYSLGAMLYELLAGAPPFETARLREGDPEETRRVVLHEEAPPPSRRVSRAGTTAGTVARDRGTHLPGLVKALRGDLDAIVMKAIAKEPDRRYGSARELAADIRRHLGNEPIEARPPAAPERLRKLVRRHPTAAAVAAVALPLAFGAAIVTTIQARRLASERDQAREISETIVGLYTTPYFPSGRQGPRDPIEILSGAARRIETEMAGRPVLQARVQHAIGEAMRATGNAETAIPLLEESARRLTSLSGATDAAALAARVSLGLALADARRFEEAEPALRSVLDDRRRSAGPDAPETLRSERDLGYLYKTMGRNDEALPLLRQSADGLRRALGDEAEESLVATSLAASVALDLKHLEEAEDLLRWVIPRMAPGIREKPIAIYNLACVQAQRGRRDEALRLLREAQSLRLTLGWFGDPLLESLFGDPEFIALAKSDRVRGAAYRATLVEWATREIGAGRPGEAEAIYRHLIEASDALDPADAAGLRARLAELLVAQGRYVEALPLMEEVVQEQRRHFPGGRDDLANRLEQLARVRLGAGDTRGALEMLDEAIGLWNGARGRSRVSYLGALRATATGDYDGGARLFATAVDQGLVDLEPSRDALLLGRLRGQPEFERARARLESRRGPFADSFGVLLQWPHPARPAPLRHGVADRAAAPTSGR